MWEQTTVCSTSCRRRHSYRRCRAASTAGKSLSAAARTPRAIHTRVHEQTSTTSLQSQRLVCRLAPQCVGNVMNVSVKSEASRARRGPRRAANRTNNRRDTCASGAESRSRGVAAPTARYIKRARVTSRAPPAQLTLTR